MCKMNRKSTEGSALRQTLCVCALWWPSGELTCPRIKECQLAKESEQAKPIHGLGRK